MYGPVADTCVPHYDENIVNVLKSELPVAALYIHLPVMPSRCYAILAIQLLGTK